MVTCKLGRTESALFLKEMYIETYLPPQDGSIRGHLSAVANLYATEPIIVDSLTRLLNEYINFEINDNLGITFNEYLDTPYIQRQIYIDHITPLLEEKKAKMAELRNANDVIDGGSS